METLSITAALFSIVGAIIAIWQATRAKKYRDEIGHDRLKIILIEISRVATNAREECRKIVTPVGKSIRGVDPQVVVNSIRDCIDRIKDNEHRFKTKEFRSNIAAIEQQLEKYINEKEESGRYAIGDLLYKMLSDIVSSVSEQIDSAI